MDKVHLQLQNIFDQLSLLGIVEKTKFCESLLFTFTLAGRGIWSDDLQTDAEKINAYKWLNELTHRIWNIHFELQQGQDNDSIARLFGNIKFYSEQSDLLSSHLTPTILIASNKLTSTL